MKGVTFAAIVILLSYYFNPHSHEGSDLKTLDIIPDNVISIHTPMKGVTLKRKSIPCSVIISIHTPMKGVTLWQRGTLRLHHFNPHSHEGSDDLQALFDGKGKISIHTPMKGVTALLLPFYLLIYISIHTPMKGVTLWMSLPLSNSPDFNPHSHEGSDVYWHCSCVLVFISIHTPMKGVTAILSNLGLLFFNFFHQFPN